MRDFKFLELAKIDAVSDSFKPSEKCCESALNSFRANIHLAALSVTTLPAFIFWTAGEWISACTRAKREIVGEDASDQAINKQFVNIHNLAEQYMAASMRTTREQQVERLVGYTTMFERFAASAGPYAEEPIDILLKHIVIQSWTSFEALAEDLIMDAIDAHPSLFASVQKEKLHFSSRDRIRAAYESSFTDDDASILSLINDQSIDALSVVRNLLIHSAGAVDKKFLAEAARYQTLTKFRALNIGESIQLDGINVRILVDGIVKNGCQLVRSIDCWIKAHK